MENEGREKDPHQDVDAEGKPTRAYVLENLNFFQFAHSPTCRSVEMARVEEIWRDYLLHYHKLAAASNRGSIWVLKRRKLGGNGRYQGLNESRACSRNAKMELDGPSCQPPCLS